MDEEVKRGDLEVIQGMGQEPRHTDSTEMRSLYISRPLGLKLL